MSESFYAHEQDAMLRVDRRSTPRPQALWSSADHLDPLFADQVQLTRVNSQYYLTFGQVRVPVVTQQSGPSAVGEIKPVARFILTHEVMDRLALLLSQHEPD